MRGVRRERVITKLVNYEAKFYLAPFRAFVF